ncbi:hypothetical protein JEP40_03250 [Proteus vulgaris]|uniref:RHS repeat-associated core domain-containing protein n=1 Tax=Proteus vulgaris TaxID=585 RepID=UPI0018E42B23|nr:RHS repeat-associated core domain-containing protein [Proteus vulgaris]MBI6528149.1 hypothetical protein [Proteus vulgaris]
MSNQQLHTRTPTVVVYDNRGSTIREINYCRHPDIINKTDERIARHHYHSRGYLERSIDARLYDTQQSDVSIQPNIQQTVSLGGALSLSKGVDNGISFNLNDIEGTVSQQINAKGIVTTYEYTDQRLARYLEKVKEQQLGDSSNVVIQQFVWGDGDTEKHVANNQVGKCIEHYDTAGKKTYTHYALNGHILSETQQFLGTTIVDWSASGSSMNNLEKAEKYVTQYSYDAVGAVLTETDAKGHQRRIVYDIAGFVKQSWVTLKGQSEQAILRSLTYSAAGQKLREEHGNGLVTIYEYEAETQRLLHVKTERPQGHRLGAKIMQDLRYEYDPVGNIIVLKNDAEATRYWRNQKVVPENRYVYDSLYQLVSATGRESANQQTPASMQSQPVTTFAKDAQSYTNYTRLYTYDRGGNLTQIRHNSPTAQQSFTQDIVVSHKTNRALLKSQCADPHKVDSYFDESGNLTKLLNGDTLLWNNRNELEATKNRIENGMIYEGETYQYDSGGQRATKLRGRKQGTSDKLEKITTHYLSNIEVWEVGEYPTREKYDVVQVQVGTSAKVRALCWEIGSPQGIENNSLRYSYDDGIGNSGLETDGKGQLVSYEEYYPYGGTAIWSSENAVEADYKTIRYSGKEKDSTGLYYYGYRYYQPWIGRWLSADPAGTVDGLNLYRMVRNNPVTLHDPDGRMPNKLNMNNFAMFNQASSSNENNSPIPVKLKPKPSIEEKTKVNAVSSSKIVSDVSLLENKVQNLDIGMVASASLPLQKTLNSVDSETIPKPINIDNKSENTLTDAHKAAIRRYTGGKYRLYNEKLRINKMASNIKNSINEVIDALNILPNYSGYVYRGAAMNKALNAGLKVNDVIYEPAFLSTSLDKAASEKFASSASAGINDIRYIMSLEVQRGKLIDSKELSEFADTEKEVLMLPKTQFQISKLEVKRGVSYIYAKELENKVKNAISLYKR